MTKSTVLTEAGLYTAMSTADKVQEDGQDGSRPRVSMLSVHGLFAGTFDFIDIENLINHRLPKNSSNAGVTNGAAIKAMVMQLASAPYQSLYRTSEYFAEVPLAALLNQGIKAEQLNRYVLSRTLDAVAEYGPKRLFLEVAAQTCRALGVNIEEVHIDSTSFHCDCAEKEEDGCELKINYGYSRDHRPDLPQVIMLGLIDGNSKLPIYADCISGNVSDHSSFFDLVSKDWPTLAGVFKDLKYLVGDSALCTANILEQAVQHNMHIVTRVPDGFLAAKKCFEAESSSEFTELNPEAPDGYTGMWCGIERIGSTPVKLLLVHNENMRLSKSKTIQRRAEKQLEKLQKELDALAVNPAACRKDAELNLAKIEKKYRHSLCRIEAAAFEEVMKYPGRGRPKKNAVKELCGVRVTAHAVIDQQAVTEAVTQEVRCVIATTDITRNWSMAELLSMYHRQNSIERMWRISKDPTIMINAIYLKNPSRISALMWILALTLLVYAATEYRLRQAADECGINELNLLEEKAGQTKKTRKSGQKKAPPYKLTLRRFKQYVQNSCICLLEYGGGQAMVLGKTGPFTMLMQHMGEAWERYYRDETYSSARIQELFAGTAAKESNPAE